MDPAWIAAAAAMAGPLVAYLKVSSHTQKNSARIEEIVGELQRRADKRSGELDEATAQIVSLSGRVRRSERDILAMKDDLRQTRDIALEIRARLS
jgi:peptidoglycan hydrolase CwlO-like protein